MGSLLHETELGQDLVAQGREEGREAGREEGREVGRIEGRAETLRRLVVRRFGDVPEADRAAEELASIDPDDALDRIAAAASIDDLLA